MRWERLFADLEAELAAAEAAELDAEVRDRSRREAARLRLVDRLRGSVGAPVVVHARGGGPVRGTLARAGADWLLVAESAAVDVLVPYPALLGVTGLGPASAAPETETAVAARLGLASALRGLARDRALVRATLVDGGVLTGTLDRVGADFVELAEHPADEARRAGAVRAAWTVPFAALAALRSGG